MHQQNAGTMRQQYAGIIHPSSLSHSKCCCSCRPSRQRQKSTRLAQKQSSTLKNLRWRSTLTLRHSTYLRAGSTASILSSWISRLVAASHSASTNCTVSTNP
eukprot:1136733-Pelagomonas_calceolata.AAC.3